MILKRRLFFSALLSLLISWLTVQVNGVYAQSQILLQQNDLVYQGSFRVPASAPGGTYGFEYVATGLVYNPARNSLYMNNHNYEHKTAEITIPVPVKSTTLAGMNTAGVIQNLFDIAEGHLSNINAGGAPSGSSVQMGGLMLYNNKIIGTSYAYYDGGMEAVLSHFTHSQELSQTGSFQGMFQLSSPQAGFVAGYMTLIPPEWQTLFGGPALTGQCCLAVIGRSSLGAAAFVFNPDDLGVKNPVPTAPVVYYDATHPTLGRWDNTTTIDLNYNMTTQVNGIAFPVGSASVLFFGRQGTTLPCYGPGTSDQTLVGTIDPASNDFWCYDPTNAAKGPHAYPYRYWVWAYNANDLVAVKKGQKNPWDVVPYASWDLNAPVDPGANPIVGVAYNPATQTLYVSQGVGEWGYPDGTFSGRPVIHVYQIPKLGGTGGGAPPPAPPASPSNATVK